MSLSLQAETLFRIASGALLVLGAAVAWATLVRRVSAAVRHWSLFGAVVAALLIPVVVLVLPAIAVPLLPAAAGSSTVVGAATPESVRGVWAVPLVIALWSAGTLAMLVRMAHGILSTRKLVHAAHEITAPKVTSEALAAAAELGLSRPVRLLTGASVRVPAAWGWLRPVVLLPPDAVRWSPNRLRAVLLHEFAHVRRADCATQFVAEFTRAVYWFVPFAWFVERRMRVEREIASDDRVLSRGARPSGYARLLLGTLRDLAARVPHSVPVAKFTTGSDIEARIRALVERAPERATVSTADRWATLLVIGVFAVPLAAVRPVPRAAAAVPSQVAVVTPVERPAAAPGALVSGTVPSPLPSIGRETPSTMPAAVPRDAPVEELSVQDSYDHMARRVVREVTGLEPTERDVVVLPPTIDSEHAREVQPHIERVAADLLRAALSGELDLTRERTFVLDDPELSRLIGGGKPIHVQVAKPVATVLFAPRR